MFWGAGGLGTTAQQSGPFLTTRPDDGAYVGWSERLDDRTERLTLQKVLGTRPASGHVEALMEQVRLRPRLNEALMLALEMGLYDDIASQLSPHLKEKISAATGKSYTLTSPHGGNGQGGGLIFQMNVVLLNNSDTNANGTIFLRKTDGTPWSVTTNRGTTSSFNFSLLPGESFRLETDGTGALTVGWAEVITDIPLSGSVIFALFNAAGQFLSEVGVGDSPRSKTIMIFVDTTDGKNTAYAVSNPDAAKATTLKLELKRLDGSIVATKENINLGARNQKSEFVTEAFTGSNVNNFKGILVITSSATEISVITLRTKDVRFTSLPSAVMVTNTDTPDPFYFSRLADGIFGAFRFQSSFVLLNNSSKKATATVELFKSDGKDLQLTISGTKNNKFTVKIPAGGGAELLSDGGTDPGVTGWAKVTSDVPLAGTGTFSIKERQSGNFVSEVGVASSNISGKVSIFAQVKGETDTGFGLTNPWGFNHTITLQRRPAGLT